MSHSLFNLASAFSIVDVETTGDRSHIGHIIEIGIVNVRNFEIADSFHSLVRPPVSLPPFITRLTGLRDPDLEQAPTFADIKDRMLAMLEGNYFVAHHVHFDYDYIKSELERLGIYFYKDRFCTVTLSRKFFPEEKKHNLDALIARFQIPVTQRHRALDDARATAEAFIRFLKMPEAEAVFSKYAETFDRRDRVRERLEQKITELPNTRGVYLFKDVNDLPLYIGKSNTIRSRVFSHLRENDIPRKRRLFRYTDHFDHMPCETELEALILESRLIKKHLPFYNEQLRVRRGYIFVKVTADDYPRMYKTGSSSNDGNEYLGPFRSGKLVDHLLDRVQKHFRLCPELMRERRSRKGACFAVQLGGCDGACDGSLNPETYRDRMREAATVIAEYVNLENKQNLDKFLNSRLSRAKALKPLRNALHQVREEIKDMPEAHDGNYIAVQAEERIGYVIQNGLLQSVLRSYDVADAGLMERVRTTIPVQILDNPETLDERLTIRRFVSSNRNKLKIIPL